MPNFLHQEAAVKSAEAGKHILLEKPLARSVEEGEKILSSVKRNGVKLMIGYDMRFDLVLNRIHDQVVNGYFGEVQIAEATNIRDGPSLQEVTAKGPSEYLHGGLTKNLQEEAPY